MKRLFLLCSLFSSIAFANSGCACRHYPSAVDITPGNYGERLDWRYGAADIRIQTTKINRQLMDRWFAKTAYNYQQGRPRIVITEIDNRTDTYIPTDMIRDIIEGAAIDDGRYTIVVGDIADSRELDSWLNRITRDPKYSNSSRLAPNQVTAPQFLGKIRITKAINADRNYTYEDYRMSVTLYDIESQEAIDSAWDVLSKKVRN